jgi:hypothetical protein
MTDSKNAQDQSAQLDNLSYLLKALELLKQGTLINYNITANGLEEKSIFGKFFAILADSLGFVTNTNVLKIAEKRYFDKDEFSNRFSLNSIKPINVTVDSLARSLLSSKDKDTIPPAKLALIASKDIEELLSNAFDSIEENQKKTVFQNLNSSTQNFLLCKNPNNFKLVDDDKKSDVLQSLPNYILNKVLIQNPECLNFIKDSLKSAVLQGLGNMDQSILDLAQIIDKNIENFEFVLTNKKIVFFNLSKQSKINLIKNDAKNFDLIFEENKQVDFNILDEPTQLKIVQTNPINFKYVSIEKQKDFLQLLNPETQKILINQNPDYERYLQNQ